MAQNDNEYSVTQSLLPIFNLPENSDGSDDDIGTFWCSENTCMTERINGENMFYCRKFVLFLVSFFTAFFDRCARKFQEKHIDLELFCSKEHIQSHHQNNYEHEPKIKRYLSLRPVQQGRQRFQSQILELQKYCQHRESPFALQVAALFGAVAEGGILADSFKIAGVWTQTLKSTLSCVFLRESGIRTAQHIPSHRGWCIGVFMAFDNSGRSSHEQL